MRALHLAVAVSNLTHALELTVSECECVRKQSAHVKALAIVSVLNVLVAVLAISPVFSLMFANFIGTPELMNDIIVTIALLVPVVASATFVAFEHKTRGCECSRGIRRWVWIADAAYQTALGSVALALPIISAFVKSPLMPRTIHDRLGLPDYSAV